MKYRQLLILLSWVTWFTVPVHADFSPPPYRPEVLLKVLARVMITKAQGVQPIAVFDLDDTLLDSRTRTKVIFDEFAQNPEIARRFPRESQLLSQIWTEGIQFKLSDTLAQNGITDPTFTAMLANTWAEKFFSNLYCRLDRPLPGAAAFLQTLVRAGARIVYLTGRDQPGMEIGTRESLRRNRFPTNPNVARLLMKSDKAMPDLEFKKNAFLWIRKQGQVVAGFENEPVNINAYADAFPEGIMVYVDTIHLSDPQGLQPKISWIRNFLPPRR